MRNKPSVLKSKPQLLLSSLLLALLLLIILPGIALANVDSYEPDNVYQQATLLPTDGTIQSHNYEPLGDADWYKFKAVAGTGYVIESPSYEKDCMPYIYLYGTDGITYIKASGPKLYWVAPASGIYYFMSNDDNGVGIKSYDIRITNYNPASIQGVVTSDAGTPLDNVYIYAYDNNGVWLDYTVTGVGGTYSFTGLPAGVVKFLIDPNPYNSVHGTKYVYGYYDNKSVISLADPIFIALGSNTKNLKLNQTASISGKVTGLDGVTGLPVGLPNILVEVYDLYNNWVDNVYTIADGTYKVSNYIRPGSYKIKFNPNWYNSNYVGSGTGYLATYYNNKSDFASAETVLVGAAQDITGKDIQLPAAGKISGIITDASGTPMPYVSVYLYDINYGNVNDLNNNANYLAATTTDGAGNYSISGLPTGIYKVKFDPSWHNSVYGKAFMSRWYNNQPDFLTVNPVIVTNGTTTTGINSQMVAGTISGKVTNIIGTATSGTALSGINVLLYNQTQVLVKSSTTLADGTYSIKDLPSGKYKVLFNPPSNLYPNLLDEYYGAVSSIDKAQFITIDQYNPSNTADAQLKASSTISGTVTSHFDSTPLSSIGVWLYDATTGVFQSSTMTDTSGKYSFSKLWPGKYKIQFINYYDYISAWYSNPLTADTIIVTDFGQILTGDTQLYKGGTITGRVVGTDVNVGLNSLTIHVYEKGSEIRSFVTDINGNYSISGLVADDYTLVFDPLWYNPSNGTNYISASTSTHVNLEQTITVNQQMLIGGSVSGTVKGTDGTLFPNAYLYFTDVNGSYVTSIFTDALGKYTINSLSTGLYKISVYVDNYNTGYLNIVNSVFVTQGQQILNDIILNKGGIISGKVTGNDGITGLPGVDVRIWLEEYNNFYSTVTANDGTYSIKGLNTANYKISIDPYNYNVTNSTNYLTQWYSSKSDWNSADPISTVAGREVTGKNVQLISGGTIKGRVIDSKGNGISGLDVVLYNINYAQYNYKTQTKTDSNGYYQIQGIEGFYKVHFDTDNTNQVNLTEYASKWYSSKGAEGFTDAETVTLASQIVQVNDQLELGGWISGNLVDQNGLAVPYNEVDVYDLAGRTVGVTYTDVNGNYAVHGIKAGEYKVKFRTWSYNSQWYYMKSDFTSASHVVVVAGQETPFVSTRLQTNVVLTGKVTRTGGTPLETIYVEVYNLTNQQISITTTDVNGNYQISGIPSGTYKIKFNTVNSVYQNYMSKWYDNKTDFTSAVPVTIDDSQTKSGVDAQLEQGGMISGHVIGPDGSALNSAYIYIYDISNSLISYTFTDVNGNYTFKGLMAGQYKLKFTYGTLVDQWYNGRQDYATATPVAVTVNQPTAGINVQMANGANITGIVKNAAGATLPDITISFFDEKNNIVGEAITDNLGSYISPLLPQGNYKIKINPAIYNKKNNKNYFIQWYNNKLDYETADIIPLIPGQKIQVADIQLAESGNISGKVTILNNVNLTDIRISVYDVNNNIIGNANTDINGSYTIKNIRAGAYKLKFDPAVYNNNNNTAYLTKWYKDKMALSTADVINVIAGQPIPSIDIQLTTTPPDNNLPALMAVDTPNNNSLVNGVIHISGWALHSWGVGKVEILKSDNTVLGLATLGISMPAVDASNPGYPDEGHSGYDFILDTVKLPNVQQVIKVKVTANNGDVLTKEVNVNVYNPTKVISIPESNSDCNLCHSQDKLKFTVAKVNKDFNCLICHQLVFLDRHGWSKPVYNSAGTLIGRFGDGDSQSYDSIIGKPSTQLHQRHSFLGTKNIWYLTRPGDDTPCERCHGKKYIENTLNITKTNCVACHKNEAQVGHSSHGASITNLIPVKDWVVDGTVYQQTSNLTCVNSNCHSSYNAPKIINENGTQLCVNCHNTTRDGYAIDKSGHVNKDNNVIHSTNYVNSNQAHDLNCSDCHTANVLTVHANLTSTTYNFNANQCSTCHSDKNTPKGTKKLNDVIKSVDLTADTNKTNCDNCHNVHYNKRDVDTQHTVNYSASNGLNCNDCHNNNGKPMNVLSLGHAGTIDTSGKAYDCATCHNNSTFHVNGVGVTDYIASVTDSKRNGLPTTTDCATCHQSLHPNNEANHTISYPAVEGQNCNSCHQLNNNNQNSPMNVISSGHANKYDFNRNQMNCGTCHNNNPTVKQYINNYVSNKLNGTSQDGVSCAKCHTLHQDYTKLHTSTYVANKIADCTSCHANKLYEEHANRIDKNGQPYNCDTCHKSSNSQVGLAIKNKNDSCDACHVITHNDPKAINPIHQATTFVANETFNCAGCHNISLSVEHLSRMNPGGPAFTCDTCHKDPRSKAVMETSYVAGFKIKTSAISSQMAINSANKSMCDACHTVHKDTNDAHYKQYAYDKKAQCTGCHKIHPKNKKN